jgi:hypothetical protein
MCTVEIEGDRLTLRPTFGALFGHFFLIAVGIALVWYGVKTYPRTAGEPEYLAFAPIGLLLIVGNVLWYRASRRPLVLDRKADHMEGCREPLSSAIKVVVNSVSGDNSTFYAVEIVFPKGPLRLGRSGWNLPSSPMDADQLAKKIAAFLGVPAEPYFQQPVPVIRPFGDSHKPPEPSQSRSDQA